jgi:pimeloyl-ACP methyl ester carboxylesterase
MNPSEFKTYSDDFAAFYNAHVAPLPHDKAVISLSFGAHLSMRAAAQHDLDIQAFVSAAPALRLQTGSEMSREEAIKGLGLLKALGRGEYFLPGTGNWLPYSDDLTVAKECGSEPKRLYRRDVILADRLDLRTGGPTINWVIELDESGSGYMASDEFKAGFDMPSKVILADGDTIIDNDYAEALCRDIESCTVEYLPDTGHCLLVERDDVLNEIFGSVDELLAK